MLTYKKQLVRTLFSKICIFRYSEIAMAPSIGYYLPLTIGVIASAFM